jgi:hypothetical protein
MEKAMIVRRRSRAARALRQALVVLLIDAVLATEAAAPAALAAHFASTMRALSVDQHWLWFVTVHVLQDLYA